MDLNVEMKNPVMRVKHLKKIFYREGKPPVTVLEDVSFDLMPGEILGLVGESGSGKSTIAKLVTKLVEPTAGEIWINEKNISGLKGKELRKIYSEIQMVFQTPAGSFDPRRTLGDGIGESLKNLGFSKEEREEKVAKLLEQCGLSPEFANKSPHEVSGGQCQRAAIARALACSPKIIIFDEATSSLDAAVQTQVLALLKKIQREQNLSYLFICHDPELVQEFCDRVIALDDGHIVDVHVKLKKDSQI